MTTDPAVPDGREERESQIAERAAKATPEPMCCGEPMVHNSFCEWWECAEAFFALTDNGVLEDGEVVLDAVDISDWDKARLHHWRTTHRTDAEVAAREDIPWLLDRLREVRDENERLRALLADASQTREQTGYMIHGRCGVGFRHEVEHSYAAFVRIGNPAVNAWCPGQWSDCGNCDDRKCMSCVLREVHEACEDDCPSCCAHGDGDTRKAPAR